jgi:hypothetical protein
MLLGTHILLPIIPLAWRRYKLSQEKKTGHKLREISVVGLFGALPDLLNPHLSLEARLSSWSHGLPFVGILTGLLLLGCIPKASPLTIIRAAYLLFAYGLHLFCDAISGGIAWLYPFSGKVIGAAYIKPGLLWFAADFFLVIAAYVLLRLLPDLAPRWQNRK